LKRGKFIAGNWKMNKGTAESLAFLGDLAALLEEVKGFDSLVPDPVDLVLFPQAINLQPMGEYLKKCKIDLKLGIQNIYWPLSGAFTGENSISSASEAGASFALVGHSERRHLFTEDDDLVAKKFCSCLENGLEPVLCVGETETQRNDGLTEKVIEDQVKAVFDHLKTGFGERERVFIAYEPVWAIGTGLNATARDAQDCCRFIRTLCPNWAIPTWRPVPSWPTAGALKVAIPRVTSTRMMWTGSSLEGHRWTPGSSTE